MPRNLVSLAHGGEHRQRGAAANVGTERDVHRALASHPVGEPVTLRMVRGRELREVEITPGEAPA